MERTDELDDVEDDPQAAIEEAQSVIDDVETSTGVEGSALDDPSGSGSTESGGGSVLPSLSLPSLSLPSPDVPEPSELFSPGYFGLALVVATAAMFLGGMVVPFVDKLGGFLALFVATFVMGLASDERYYLETGLASGLVVGILSVVGRLELALFTGFNLSLLFLGTAATGLVVGVLGTYFGRDLKAGLGKSVGGGDGPGGEDPPEW